MKPNKKWLYWIGGILLFLLALNFGINLWIKSALPKIINEKNDTAYNFDYENLGFSIFNSSVYVEGISITLKKDFPERPPVDFNAKVGEIRVVGVNFVKLLTQKDLSAFNIKINEPDIVFYKPEQKDTTQSQSKLGNSIHVSNFEINDGIFQMFDSDKKTKLSQIDHIDIEIGGVNLSQRTLEKDIPFTYSSFQLLCGNIFFQVNPSQELKASSLKVNDNLFILNNFKINSIDSISNLSGNSLNYRLLPDVKAPTVTFTGLDWGYDKADDFYFEAGTLKFDSVDINIKNTNGSKEERKDSLGHLIPFKLDINKILVDNSRLRVKNSLDAQNINIRIDKIQNKPNENLSVESILLNHPLVTTFSGGQKKSSNKKSNSEFIDHIMVKKFEIKDAVYNLNKLSNNQNLLKVSGINFLMNDIELTPKTFSEKIPIIYKDTKFTATSLDYNPNHIYSLKTKNVNFDNGSFSLDQFEMKPKISRTQFVRQLKKEKDLYTITAKKVSIQKMDFGFNGNDMFFKIPNIDIQTAIANIYRSKIPTDDPKKKQLYSKLLRDLPFVLEVKNIDLKNSQIEYEEETLESTGAGKLTFSNFNANIKNVYSGYKKSSVPDVRADIKTNFMNDSKLNAIWTFNPMNRSEKFNIKGSIFNFDAKKMTPFVKPYLHVTAEGNMKEVRFNFTGNDINATGDFGVKYQDLKVTLYNKDNGKVRKVLSTLGNFLVKSNTGEQYKEERIKTVERKQDRSFFNFFWLCVQQGLKQTLLVI